MCNASFITMGCLLNYETDQRHVVVIRVSDDGSPPTSSIFPVTVTVTDTNDPPYGFELTNQQNGIMEDWPIGEPVATLSVKDDDTLLLDEEEEGEEDAGRSQPQELTFQLLNSNESVFSVEGNQIILTENLDFETEDQYVLHVAVSDDSSQPLTVNLASD